MSETSRSASKATCDKECPSEFELTLSSWPLRLVSDTAALRFTNDSDCPPATAELFKAVVNL